MEPAASTSIAENPTKFEADVTKANSGPSAAPNSDTPLILVDFAIFHTKDGDLRPTRADETRAEVGEDFFKAEQEWEVSYSDSQQRRLYWPKAVQLGALPTQPLWTSHSLCLTN